MGREAKKEEEERKRKEEEERRKERLRKWSRTKSLLKGGKQKLLDRSSSKEGGEMSPDTQEESQHPVDQEEYSERGERDNNIRGVTSPGGRAGVVPENDYVIYEHSQAEVDMQVLDTTRNVECYQNPFTAETEVRQGSVERKSDRT